MGKVGCIQDSVKEAAAKTRRSAHSAAFLEIADEVTARLKNLTFGPPVEWVYYPLEYARETYGNYAGRYGGLAKQVVLVGMNPGPWGMTQTGVPFGEVSLVRDWLKVRGNIGRPQREHPKRRVEGFACQRSEVSGTRLWGWARERFGTPQEFFKRFFVANYCPMLFLEASGRNVTPDKLRIDERAAVEAICDIGLRNTIELLQPEIVIGIGHYAEKSALRALSGMDLKIGRILHPSPASPLANKDWGKQAEKQLRALGISIP